MQVQQCQSPSDLQRIAPVLLQLRTQYTAESLTRQIKQQLEQGYQLAYVEQEQTVICVAGFVIRESLAWGKHMYVDDLVTDASVRSSGAGRRMIEWLKSHARQQHCEQLHLDSGVQRYAAHRFYLREGFSINCHHFALESL